MSDKLYDVLYESWQQMSNPTLITEAEVKATFPTYNAKQLADVKAICEGYLKFEEILLGNTTEVLLERFAGDDQAMVPSSTAFDPNQTLGKPQVPAAPAAQAKKPGMWDKMKGMAKGGKDALVKGKEFVNKVKELYTKYNGNKILIVLAAGLVISTVVPLLPGGAAIAAAAKVAFGGFNIFKGGKSFWTEFNKEKKDRSTVKLVLAVLQTGLGIFSGVSGGNAIASQISALKQQVVSSAGDAAQAAPAAHAAAATDAGHAATGAAGAAGSNVDKIIHAVTGSKDQLQAYAQDPQGFSKHLADALTRHNIDPGAMAKDVIKGFTDNAGNTTVQDYMNAQLAHAAQQAGISVDSAGAAGSAFDSLDAKLAK
jgi:hypothetical protein